MSRLAKLQQLADQWGRMTIADVHVSRANYRTLVVGRWWRIPGRYNVFIPGRIHVGPLRYRQARGWIVRLAWQHADTARGTDQQPPTSGE